VKERISCLFRLAPFGFVTPLVRSGGRWLAGGGASSRVGCAWRSAVVLLLCAMESAMFNALLFALFGGITVSCLILMLLFGLWPLGYVAVFSAIVIGCIYFIHEEEL